MTKKCRCEDHVADLDGGRDWVRVVRKVSSFDDSPSRHVHMLHMRGFRERGSTWGCSKHSGSHGGLTRPGDDKERIAKSAGCTAPNGRWQPLAWWALPT